MSGRISAGRRAGRVRRRRPVRGRRAAAPDPKDLVTVRLVVCGCVFVVLVLVKLLFPQTVARLAWSAGQLIGRDADFQAAFAAVGRAISGEEAVSDSLQDACTAVFNPSAGEIAAEGGAGAAAACGGTRALPALCGETVRYAAARLPEVRPADPEPQEAQVEPEAGGTGEAPAAESPAATQPQQEEGQFPDDTTTTEAISKIYTMAPMPPNASLDQRDLGFAHQSPVCGPLTSPFGWRDHPVSGENKFHYGVDLGAASGTDILAFADGTVYAVGESSTLGNYVMLRHEGGYITLYAHCSRVTVSGGSISMGEKIAEVGETGVATGPHLHFELQDGELYLNPIYYVDLG